MKSIRIAEQECAKRILGSARFSVALFLHKRLATVTAEIPFPLEKEMGGAPLDGTVVDFVLFSRVFNDAVMGAATRADPLSFRKGDVEFTQVCGSLHFFDSNMFVQPGEAVCDFSSHICYLRKNYIYCRCVERTICYLV